MIRNRPLSDAEKLKLGKILAQAASPTERASGDYFQPLPQQDNDLIAMRETAWIKAVTNGDRALFDKLLAVRGLSAEDVRKRLGNVVLADFNRLPSWGEALVEMLEAGMYDDDLDEPITQGELIPSETLQEMGLLAETPWRFQKAFAPFLCAANRWLEQRAAELGLVISRQARRKLSLHLLQRLLSVTANLLIAPIQLIDTFGGCTGRVGASFYEGLFAESQDMLSAWLDLIALFPASARALGIMWRHWGLFAQELLERLAVDQALLAKEFFDRQTLGELIDCAPASGDTHDHGRTVTILTFAGDKKVVYKPRDLRIAAVFMNLVELLNTSLDLPLPTRKILPRANYTWEEFITARPCENLEQVRHFYTRMGMYLGLLELLGGTDFTIDNLLVVGENPVLIDLETLFTPRWQINSAELNPVDMDAHDIRPPTTLLQIGMLPAPVTGDPGRRATDYAPLGNWNFALPFRSAMPRKTETGEIEIIQDYMVWKPSSTTPILLDAPTHATDYAPEILNGYHAMHVCLRQNSQHLMGDQGLLAQMAEMPVRSLFRNSQLYIRVQETSLVASSLRDGTAREISLERLWKKYLTMACSPGLVVSEIDGVRDLDIPLFQAHPGDTALFLTDGAAIPNVFESTALNRAQKHLAQMNDASLHDGLDIIKTALGTVAPNLNASRFARTHAPHTSETRIRDADGWLEQAITIGRLILAQAQSNRTGELMWMGLTHLPWCDARLITLLSPDILSGTGGIAIVLADLARLSRLDEFAQATRSIWMPLERGIKSWDLIFSYQEHALATKRPDLFYCGAFYGIGASVYALVRSQRALEDTGHVANWARHLDAVSLPVLEQASPSDLISGKAGFVLALAQMFANGEYPQLATIATALGRNLIALRSDAGIFPLPPYPEGITMLDGLADTQAGIALALTRLATITHSAEFALDDQAFESLTQMPLRLTAGALLVRLALARERSMMLDSVLSAVRGWLECDLALLLSKELLEHLEVAITLFQVSGQDEFYARAVACGNELVLRHRMSGSWFPEYLTVDRHNLSAVTGVSAIAHAFMKLASPQQVSSIRLLE
jgi:type 2 lantibiotic biosynthesis protein LanM